MLERCNDPFAKFAGTEPLAIDDLPDLTAAKALGFRPGGATGTAQYEMGAYHVGVELRGGFVFFLRHHLLLASLTV